MSDDFVICNLCNKSFKSITSSHLKRHNITKQQYQTQFPNAHLISVTTLKRKQAAAIVSNKKRIGVSRSDITRKKISEANKGKTAWNKGVSRTTEQNKQLSNTMKSLYATGELVHWNTGKVTSVDVRKKISNTALSQHRTYSDNSKKKRHITMLEKIQNGWVYPSTLRKGQPLNLSNESRNKIRNVAIVNNNKRKGGSEHRIVEHLSQYGIELLRIDVDRYNYHLHCINCDTNFVRTKSVLVPYRYEVYQGKYCPVCYPKVSGYYSYSYFDYYPQHKQHPGIFYLIELSNKNEKFLKVGITSKSVDIRWKHELQYQIVSLIEIPMTLFEAFQLEFSILSQFNDRYVPLCEFGGKTECFEVVQYDDILNGICEHLPSKYLE